MKTKQVRKHSKSAQPAAQAPNAAAKIEHSGDWVTQNFWVKIGLTKAQLKLLGLIARKYRFKNSPTATAARMLVSVALADHARSTQLIDHFISRSGFYGHLSCGNHFEAYARAELVKRDLADREQAAAFHRHIADCPPLPAARAAE